MAEHRLIEAQLRSLAAGLPADVVDELADGLHETYRHHLDRIGDPDTAARAALDEFGDVATINTGFVRASVERQIARTLLVATVVVALMWGVVIVPTRPWDWPIPVALRTVWLLVIAATIISLARAARGRRDYRRTRRAATAGVVGMIMLDAVMLGGFAYAGVALAWPVVIAAGLSLVRLTITLRALTALVRA